MDALIGTLEKVIPFLEKYDDWVKWVAFGWILLTAIFLGTLLVAPKKNNITNTQNDTDSTNMATTLPQQPQWNKSGDPKIDVVLEELNSLHKKGKDNISDEELAETLSQLFNRPAFYGIREENFNHFLYPLCKSRVILEFYQPYFSLSKVRSEISKAIQLMVQLQNDVAKIYGVNFSITAHIGKYIDNSNEFILRLPNQKNSPDQKFYNDRDKTIRQIRDILRPIDLAN